MTRGNAAAYLGPLPSASRGGGARGVSRAGDADPAPSRRWRAAGDDRDGHAGPSPSGTPPGSRRPTTGAGIFYSLLSRTAGRRNPERVLRHDRLGTGTSAPTRSAGGRASIPTCGSRSYRAPALRQAPRNADMERLLEALVTEEVQEVIRRTAQFNWHGGIIRSDAPPAWDQVRPLPRAASRKPAGPHGRRQRRPLCSIRAVVPRRAPGAGLVGRDLLRVPDSPGVQDRSQELLQARSTQSPRARRAWHPPSWRRGAGARRLGRLAAEGAARSRSPSPRT